MACAVCPHCDTALAGEAAPHAGRSYHAHCRHCYVCGERDLHAAETFRGVIFCSACAKRIFQGCSSARAGRTRRARGGVLAAAQGTADPQRSDHAHSCRKNSVSPRPSPRATVVTELKKDSAERGTATDATQAIIDGVRDSALGRHTFTIETAKPRKKRKTHRRKKKTEEDTDLRIAELGASVEIAHMALRNQSEVPIVIKSDPLLKLGRSHSLSALCQDSEVSRTSESHWRDSLYSRDSSLYVPWTQRRIASILKIPLRYFKRNILDRSSVVSVASDNSCVDSHPKKLKMLFNNDIIEHQRHGLKKLYSTINHKSTPCKLGWLHFKNQKLPEKTSCKHAARSHSYRCMREQAMRLAGPTRSELAVIRGKILNAVSPNIVKKIFNYSE